MKPGLRKERFLMKKFLSLLLTATLVSGMLLVPAGAAENSGGGDSCPQH